MIRATRRPAQRGSVLIVVLIILVALLAGGGVALYLQLGNTRGTGLVRFARAALFCAEGGLQQTRQIIINNYPDWNDALSGANPSWYAADMDCDGTTETPGKLSGDLGDGGTCPDWEVSIYDNQDEFDPNPLDPAHDNDLHIFVQSTCLMFQDTQPRRLVELVSYEMGGENYAGAGQGAQHTGGATGMK
jgi:hypothetical protein